MLTKEDLELLSQMLDEKLDKKFDEKLAPIYQELNEIKEEAHITRVSLNSVLECIDVYFRKEYPLPADKKKII